MQQYCYLRKLFVLANAFIFLSISACSKSPENNAVAEQPSAATIKEDPLINDVRQLKILYSSSNVNQALQKINALKINKPAKLTNEDVVDNFADGAREIKALVALFKEFQPQTNQVNSLHQKSINLLMNLATVGENTSSLFSLGFRSMSEADAIMSLPKEEVSLHRDKLLQLGQTMKTVELNTNNNLQEIETIKKRFCRDAS